MEKGLIHLEGATFLQLTHKITKEKLGPSSKDSDRVFYNPAMAGSRTRSVILMKNIIAVSYTHLTLPTKRIV